jgi:hypothetical protein
MKRDTGLSGRNIAKYERLSYSPGLKDTTDMEGGTKTITKTAEDTGLANADYTKAMTACITPTDARWAVMMGAARAAVTIDSDDGTHDLRCRVYMDVQDANHLLFDLTFTSTGAQLSGQNIDASTKATIWACLNDGAAHNIYWYFWTPGNHAPVISLVQVWYGLGAVNGGSTWNEVMRCTHIGWFIWNWQFTVVGTGNAEVWCITPKAVSGYNVALELAAVCTASVYSLNNKAPKMAFDGVSIWQVNPTVATDLRYLNTSQLIIRTD